MKVKSLKLKTQSRPHPPYELITPPTPSYLKRGWRRQGRYFKGRMGGVTLIELVITMVLMGIVAVIVANVLSTGVKGSLITDYRKEALDQARVAMDRMAKELRNLQNSASVTTSSDTQLCFTMLDGTNNNVVVNYSYSNPDIKREAPSALCTAGNGQTLATKIAATFSFAYIQANGTADSTFSSVTTERIRIIIPSTVSGETVTLETEVWPRNL
jgi:prepilin-type N-terminal cleavage/methylation domain-containing protein